MDTLIPIPVYYKCIQENKKNDAKKNTFLTPPPLLKVFKCRAKPMRALIGRHRGILNRQRETFKNFKKKY